MKGLRCMMAVSLPVVLLLVLSGCGGGDDQGTTAGVDTETTEARSQQSQEPRSDDKKLKSIKLTLEGQPDAENVGVLVADQRGYFADEGLDVDVLTPVDSDNVPIYVKEGFDEIGLLTQPEVVMASDKGMPLVAIGSLVRQPTSAMIWLKKSKIDSVADLEGKTIAVNGLSSEEGFLEAVLAQAGLTFDDVKIKRLGYLLVPALAKGRADAIFGVSGNVEGVELKAQGLEPVVTPVRSLGIPSYEELVVITRRDRLSRKPGWIRAFMAAVTRGTAAAIADPGAGAEAIAAIRKELGYPEAPPKLTRAKIKATLPLLSKSSRMSSGRATGLADWMREQGLIRQGLPSATWLTNRFVEPSSR